MKNYSRPLHDNQLASDFMIRVLGFKNSIEVGDNIQKVVTAEKLLQSTTSESTLKHKNNRHPFYETDDKRRQLREQIFEELVFKNRLENDDSICLGEGGATSANVKKEGKAFIVIGLPASGKSTIATMIAEKYNAALVDSDYAKRKFPEYCLPQGASVVHDESSLVTFGPQNEDEDHDEPSVYEYFTKSKTNIVIPKIGHDETSVIGLRDALFTKKDCEYEEVHLILVSVDREISTKRALDRFLKTERYVPLGLVFDVFANDPTLAFYRVKDCERWTSTGKVSTSGSSPSFVFGSNEKSPAKELFGGLCEH